MIEGAYGGRVEPEALDGEERARWAARLGDAWESSPPGNLPKDLTRCWLQAEGRRLGTIALSDPYARGTLHVSGLYIRAAERGRGLAGAALELAQRAAERQGRRGITLDAAWAWGRPLALYLRLGFRVYHWKRDIRLVRERDQPAPTFAVQGDVATYTVDQRGPPTATSPALPLGNDAHEVGDERRRVLLRAVRHGARLGWEQPGGERAGATVAPQDPSTAATFALHLALAGFPLVRSRADWDAHPSGDIGGPELLARRILWWEALARRDGYQVVPGPVPGLTYRSYPDFLDPPELAVHG